jgi:hypothetical protein
MTYGNIADRPYGWASSAETEMMLAAPELNANSCPPAIGGHPGDWYVVPAGDDYWFWKEWHERRGLDREWARAGIRDPFLREPEIIFYLGTHNPSWLWSGAATFPLCVSYGRLRSYKALRQGMVGWILDSRGFSELSQHGRWTIPAERYVADVARYDAEIGGLQWASPQDWMFTRPVDTCRKPSSSTSRRVGPGTRKHQDALPCRRPDLSPSGEPHQFRTRLETLSENANGTFRD